VSAVIKDVAGPAGAGRWIDSECHPHAATAVAVAEALGVDPTRGLRLTDIAERRERYGTNTLQSIRPRPAWRILLGQFASLVFALLAAAALVALATGDVVDAIAILVVLVLNALVGFATEWQAGRALDALRAARDRLRSIVRGRKS